MPTSPAIAPASIGLALGAATSLAVRRLVPNAAAKALAVSLVPVALVYPAARRSGMDAGPAVAREAAGVAAMAGLAALAMRSDRPAVLAGIGWLAHAGFDAWHEAGPGSRIPGWYPAFCAGYDVAVGADLLLRRA